MAQPQPETLAQRLGRFPVDTYPVQHATTQFHLGSQLLQAGKPAPAVDALTVARDVFARTGMTLEAAKATLMLGVAHRTAGRLDDATHAFTDAGSALAALDQPAEHGAASYNLGLVRQDADDRAGACVAWTVAREAFLAGGFPAQAAAAARDHGALLLAAGEVEAALPLLEQAAALAERAGDDAGTAAAANVLGLAHLAAGEVASAVAVLRRALGFVPRGTRPVEHAMVKANLALAHEQSGRPDRARLAAAQALAVPGAAAPVRAQALDLLSRIPGRLDEDLMRVLDDEERDQWPAVVREELLRVPDGAVSQRTALVRAFLDGALARPAAVYDLVEALLQVVLELPPRPYEAAVGALVAAAADRPEADAERLRAVVASALARFALPQWQRLVASLNAAADACGQPAGWR